jgi:hypothetical protein
MEYRDDFFVQCNWISRELINLRMAEVGGGPFCAFLVVAGKPHANFCRVVDQVFDKLEKGTKYLPSNTESESIHTNR